MRVAIVGAGAVGRSIAGELLSNGHAVMLIEKDGRKVRTRAVPGAEWVQADACEVSSLEEAELATCDVVIAATGDDKANLVVSLLAKTEFAANLVEITLAEDTPWVGKPLREVPLPRETVLTAVLRGDRVITPTPDEPLEAGDELLFITHADVEEQLQQVLSPAH